MKGKMKAENEYKRGLWTEEEDRMLQEYVKVHGRGRWNRIPKITGLKRCGKSCRLRWLNYLSPNVKKGDFSEEEEDLIIRLHNLLGNRWSLIAGRVPGRTDNQVKNHWNSHLRKKVALKKEAIRQSMSSSNSEKTGTEQTERHGLPDNSGLLQNSKAVTDAHDQSNAAEAQIFEQHEAAYSPLFPDDQFHLNSPGLVGFLDEYPLDLFWQDF